jgi:ubiquinone/menaquinone biosynthesis C-methylase UbiE
MEEYMTRRDFRRIFGALLCLGIWLSSFAVPALSQNRPFQIEDWERQLNERQPPVPIMDAIDLQPGMVIGEIGAGTGRMTMWLADRVGDSGKVYANDINKDSLDRLRERSREDGFENIEILLGEEDDPKLPAGALDMVFMINVYHHLDDPRPLIRNIRPSLNSGGRLVIVECDPEKVDWGEEEGCTSRKDMAEELHDAGFELLSTLTFLNEDNIYIARPAKR